MEKCELCDMNVRNVKVHWKLNHKKKTSSRPGLTGFTSEHRKVESPSRTVKKEPDIIARIVPPSSSSVTISTVVGSGQPAYDFSNTNLPTFDIERCKNVSLLRELIDVDDGKMMGKKYNKEISRSLKFDECPDCHQKFEFQTETRRDQREYMDHVNNCGRDVGSGGGAIMKVIQSVACQPKIGSISEDLIGSQEMTSGLINTELMDFVKQELKTNETARNENDIVFIKSEVINNTAEQDSQVIDRTNQQAVNSFPTVKKEIKAGDCTSRAQDEDFITVNNEDFLGLIKSEVRKETESIVNCTRNLGEYRPTQSDNCGQCEAKLQDGLMRHKQNVHERVTYSCDQCMYKTKRKAMFRRHKKSGHKGVTYSWDQCCDSNMSQLNDQLETVIREISKGLFSCLQCGKTSGQKSNLKRHIASKHKHLEGPVVRCKFCEKTCKNKPSLQTHVSQHHRDEYTSYKNQY